MSATAKAAESVEEAALILRDASSIADPYLRADRIWEAVERLHESFTHARTRSCEVLAFALEAICDGTTPPPVSGGVLAHARSLEGYGRTLRGLGVANFEPASGRCTLRRGRKSPTRRQASRSPRWRQSWLDP